MICVLREPVDRIVSLFYFWRGKNIPSVPPQMTIEQFLRSDNPGFVMNTHNMQTWQIAHSLHKPTQRKLELSDDALLERALRNLHKISIIGLTQRLDDFSAKIGKRIRPELAAIAARQSHQDPPPDWRALRRSARAHCRANRAGPATLRLRVPGTGRRRGQWRLHTKLSHADKTGAGFTESRLRRGPGPSRPDPGSSRRSPGHRRRCSVTPRARAIHNTFPIPRRGRFVMPKAAFI